MFTYYHYITEHRPCIFLSLFGLSTCKYCGSFHYIELRLSDNPKAFQSLKRISTQENVVIKNIFQSNSFYCTSCKVRIVVVKYVWIYSSRERRKFSHSSDDQEMGVKEQKKNKIDKCRWGSLSWNIFSAMITKGKLSEIDENLRRNR